MRSLFAAALVATVLAACAPGAPKFESTDISSASFGRDFALIDHTGQPRKLADFRGTVVVMFFGFTQCPDVCPTAMGKLAAAMNKLGADASRVQGLFVTVDPERDTPALLKAYVPAFDPRFLGLYGDADATAAVAKEFKVIYQKSPGKTAETYSMDHSSGMFVFDPLGKLRLYVSHGQGVDALAHDLRELLRESR